MRALALFVVLSLVPTLALAGEVSSSRRRLDASDRLELTGATLMGTGVGLLASGAAAMIADRPTPCDPDDICENVPIGYMITGPQLMTAGVGAIVWGAVSFARGRARRAEPVAVPVLVPSSDGAAVGVTTRF